MPNLYELRDELLAKIKASNNGSSCLYDLGCGQNLGVWIVCCKRLVFLAAPDRTRISNDSATA